MRNQFYTQLSSTPDLAMNGWDWVWITISAPVAFWALAHVISMIMWQHTARVYRLRLARGTTAEHIAGWVGQLAAVVRVPRWWDLFPRWPIGIELVASEHGVDRLIVIHARLHTVVAASLAAALPGARLTDTADIPVRSSRYGWRKAGEIRLRGPHHLLDADRAEEVNRHILAALQPLGAGEVVRVQWLLAGARAPRAAWLPERTDQIVRPYWWGTTQTIVRDRRRAVGIRWRHTDPVFSAVCRVAVAVQDRAHARAIARRMWAALRGLNVPGAQIIRRWLLPGVLVAARVTYRSIPVISWPLTLTSREITGLLGLATGPFMLPGVSLGIAPALPPSPIMPTTGLVIGRSNYPGIDRLLCLERDDRLRHVWVAGPTGVGKSTLLANLIGYDISQGDPVIVIDAGGDLVTDILARIPKARHEDVIVLDPASRDRVIGLNPLLSSGSDDYERAAGLVFHVLHSIYADSWGPRTADILRAGLLTLIMTFAPGGQRFTICELAELFTNTAFRRFVISQPLTPALDSFWRWYQALSDTHQAQVISPALNKLRVFSLYTPLRLLLGQSTGVDIAEAMHRRRIILVPLRTGLLGAETAALIGSLVMASVWQAILARAAISKDQRHPVWMYLDEFQHVVRLPIDLADMLTQARGFGLGLTLAHQHLGQLSPEIKSAVLGTTRSQLIFQVESPDASELASRFAPLTRDDLMSLGLHEIALRPCVNSNTLPPVTGITDPLPAPVTDPAALAQASSQHYGMPAARIEAQINQRTMITTGWGKRANRADTGAAS